MSYYVLPNIFCNINENNLKTMCHRARLKIAKKMGEKNE